MEKPGKIYLSQLIKVNVNSDVMLIVYKIDMMHQNGSSPLWSSSPLPIPNSNYEKMSNKPKLKDILQNSLLIHLKQGKSEKLS